MRRLLLLGIIFATFLWSFGWVYAIHFEDGSGIVYYDTHRIGSYCLPFALCDSR